MRNKLYKMAQAATLAVAMAFTFSCSDDDGGGGNVVLACKFADTKYGEVCQEFFEEKLDKHGIDKQQLKDECEKMGTSLNSCPSGYTVKCSDNDGNYYFYDQKYKGMTCKDLDNDDK